MLMFAAKMYQVTEILDVLKPMLKSDVSLQFMKIAVIWKTENQRFWTFDCNLISLIIVSISGQ